MANENLSVIADHDDLSGLRPDVAVIVHALSSETRWGEICGAGPHTFRDYIRSTFPQYSDNDVLSAADKLHKAYSIFNGMEDVKVVAAALKGMAAAGESIWDEDEGFNRVMDYLEHSDHVWDAPADMPTPTGPPQSFGSGSGRAPCRFFASPAGCRNGANCPFSHESGAPTKPPCRFFQAGNCQYGNNCNFAHTPAGGAPSFAAPKVYGRSGNVTAEDLEEEGKFMILGGPTGMVEAELDGNGEPIVPKGCTLVTVMDDGTIVCPKPK